MKYRDFNIRILGQRDGGYDVSVDSPAGSSKTHIKLDIDDVVGQVQQLGGNVRSASREAEFQSEATQTPAEIGAQLYEALFSGRRANHV